MELEASHKKVLEYLLKHSPANTFRLSRHLGIDRHELIAIIKDLTKKKLVEFKHGSVSINEIKYQKFIENKESLNISKPVSKPKAEKERFLNQKEEEIKKREESVFAAEKKLEEDKEALRKEQENINKQKSEIYAIGSKIKPKRKRKRVVKKAKLKKGEKKSKGVRTKRLRKGKQGKLESWLRQAKLEIERLKVEIELASMSHNASEIRSLEASAAKLRNMIDWRMREK